jgi:ribosomal protein L30
MLSSFKELENKKIKIKQIKGDAGYEKSQRDTIVGLGLKGVNTEAEVKVTKAIYGMLAKVKHLIAII